jgi:pimeloyl-ACP methyl ester carboxylesterase
MQTIVLIPGLGSDGAVWRRTVAVLGDRVDCLIGDTHSDDTLAGMARRILDQAPERFALAGVSMGGVVAMEVMRRAPERVSHLALVDTNALPDTFGRKLYRHLANLVVGTTRNFRRQAEGSLRLLVNPDAPQDVRAELVDMSVRVGARAYVRQNRAVIARGDLRAVLPGIRVPTFVIVGKDDQMTPVSMSREIQRRTPGSTLHIIPNCGHLPPIEKPDAVAGLLLELLQRS